MSRDALCALTAAALLFSVARPAIAGPVEDAQAATDREDYAAALAILRPLAARGDPAAESKLGFLYLAGVGVPADRAQALIWYGKATAQDYWPAISFVTALCAAAEPPPPQDCADALARIRAAAERGVPEAQMRLGGLYVTGKGGVEKDAAKGLGWIRKAADQGLAAAQLQMGLMTASSLFGVSANPAESLVWYRKAADQGNVAGMDALAMEYDLGVGGAPKDKAQAIAWYRKAAERNDMIALSTLAQIYEDGDGVAKDPAEAFRLSRKLAEQGIPDAMAKTGSAYATGKGVTKDDLQAYAWLSLAVEANKEGGGRSDDLALALDGVASRLSAAQVTEAKGLAATIKARFDAS